MEELIAKRYATALSSVSKDIKGIANVLNVLTEVITTEDVKTALTSPIVPAEKKTEMILSALGNDVDTTLVNFIKILGENKRLRARAQPSG
jgi:F-type H+-transporting ATPase subunit delta